MKAPTVLLILDDLEDLEIYGTFLRDSGYEIRACNYVGEGVNFLETESFSLVIVSQDTPTFAGREALKRSRLLHPEVPVLVVARDLNMHFYLEAMELGATDYLERPKPRELVWLVDTLILQGAIV